VTRAGACDVPRQVVYGEHRHGVVRYAREIAAAVGTHLGGDVSLDGARAPGGEAALTGSGRLHLHFTDRIWGDDPADAARRIEGLAARVPVTATLHDLPQASDRPASLARRIDCYRRVVRASKGIVVSSEHEAALLRDVVRPVEPVVIPLPVDVRPASAQRATPDDEVALVGFVYPGKGHAEVIAAVAALVAAGRPSADGLGVTALGRASAGHEAELGTIVDDAARLGVRFTVTGFLDEATMLERCRRASVAVAAHQHVSASGSIVTWVAAGRRPLVPDTRYSREMAALRPGTLTLYASEGLADAIDRARGAPGSTWCEDDATTGPSLQDVAAAYVAWWTDDVAW